MIDESSLVVQPCGMQTDVLTWTSAPEMGIALASILSAEACGIVTGRIDLTQGFSPNTPINGVFPDYDVQVVLNLDAETSGTSSYSYVSGSTVFTGFTNLAGGAVASAEPVFSSNRLTWTLGDLRSNGVGAITYRLRASCDWESGEQQTAWVLFNSLCQDGTAPTRRENALTNAMPPVLTANLSYQLKPEILFLQNNTAVFTLDFLNSGAGTAYNVQPEFVMPTGMSFAAGSVAPTTVSATNLVWTLPTGSPVGNLIDADGDGGWMIFRPAARSPS